MKKKSLSTRLSAQKAKKILHDGTVRGHRITGKQRRFFGAVVSMRKKRR